MRNKRRHKSIDEENISYEDGANSQLNHEASFNYNESKEQYLPCRLPDGSQMRVRFIV